MSQLEIKKTARGYQLIGELTFANVNEMLEQTPDLTTEDIADSDDEIMVDVGQLTTVDSAGLSAILHWNRAAIASGKTYRLENVSEKLAALIEVTGLAEIISSDS